MTVLPDGASVPARLDLPAGGHLRPLVPSDVDLVHSAIGEHRSWLADLLPEGDPSGLPNASPGDDLRALERLHDDAREGRAFVYLLVDESWSEAIGAFSLRLADGVPAASWWVVPALQASRLEEELDGYARQWLRMRWQLEAVETPDNHPEDPAAVAGANLVPLLPETPDRTPLVDPDAESARALWEEYRGSGADAPRALPPVEPFGDSVEMADELLALVRRGVKTATASLPGSDRVAVGDHWIVCDGSGAAALVLRTTEVRVGPLDSVDDDFAWAEGEGDRSRSSWLDGHRRFFSREAPEGFGDVVFERFEVVWPEADAERARESVRSIAADRPADRHPLQH
jgi:uncharacterized protein YhfF